MFGVRLKELDRLQPCVGGLGGEPAGDRLAIVVFDPYAQIHFEADNFDALGMSVLHIAGFFDPVEHEPGGVERAAQGLSEDAVIKRGIGADDVVSQFEVFEQLLEIGREDVVGVKGENPVGLDF